MTQLYRAFEVESKKPGKFFHELVRHRRRELGLPAPREDRILPFRSKPSASLPAIDLVIDDELTGETLPVRQRLLRTERRIEELDAALDAIEPREASIRRRRQLAEAYEHELTLHVVLSQTLATRNGIQSDDE